MRILEYELLSSFEAKPNLAHGAAVRKLDAFNIGRADQAPIERVGPAVILASQNIFASAAEGDGSGAMATDVTKGSQRAFLVANDDNGFVGDIGVVNTFWTALCRLDCRH